MFDSFGFVSVLSKPYLTVRKKHKERDLTWHEVILVFIILRFPMHASKKMCKE